MKTFIVFIAGFALAVLGLMSFESYLAARRDGKICHECRKDNFNEIPLGDFFKDIGRYHGTHAKAVTPGTAAARGVGINDIDPSRVCMYTLDTLKKFICFIETYAEASGVSTKNLGVNFYYAVYPKEKSFNGRNYGSLHTLYLTPTFYDADSNKYEPFDAKAMYHFKLANPRVKDISPRTFSLSSLRQNLNHKAFMLSASTFSTLTTSPDEDFRINQGQLCPPACEGIRLYDDIGPY